MSIKASIRGLAGIAVLVAVAVAAPAATAAAAGAATGGAATAPDLAANKQLMRRMIEDLWNGGHMEVCDELFTKEGVLHYRGHNIPAGPAECRRAVALWRGGLDGFHFATQAVVAEGDLVSAYLTFTGKHVQPLLGVAPSGKDVKVEEVLMGRIANGKIAELWELYDEYAFRRYTGDIPPPPAPPAPPAPSAPPAPPAGRP